MTNTDDYTRLYNNGWRAGQAGSAKFDGLNPKPWDDGYMDAATDKPKWHRRDCAEPNHDDCPDRSR